MPEECLSKLEAAVSMEAYDNANAAAELHLNSIRVKRFSSADAYIRRGNARRALGDPVGAIVDWAAAFEMSSIAARLNCLSCMMSITNTMESWMEVSKHAIPLERAAAEDKYAAVWPEVAVRTLEVMG